MNKTAFNLICVPLALAIAFSQGTQAIICDQNCIPLGYDIENKGYKQANNGRKLTRQRYTSSRMAYGSTFRSNTNTKNTRIGQNREMKREIID